MYQFMQADGNRLLKCPNLCIKCLDARCFMRTPFLAEIKLAVTDFIAARECGWEWLLMGGTQQR